MASQVFTTIGNQNWNWPAGVTSVVAECLGGGGGGGTASGNPATGGGGKGGSYSKVTITKGAETQLTVSVGSGGVAASAGGVSYVMQASTALCWGPGGTGGATQATSSANGAGATTQFSGPNIGTTQFIGGNGGTGNFTSGTQGSGAGGGAAGPTSDGGAGAVNVAGTVGTGTWADGGSYQKAGAAGVGNSTPGINGANYGAGGSGGKANSGTDQNGGVGGQGIIVLTWTATAQSVTTVAIASTAVLRVPVVVGGLLAILGATIPTIGAAYTPLTVQSGQITGTLTNFPVLVDRTDARFKSISNGGRVIRTDGFDLVPYADSALTTKLDFERELYDPVTGHFIDWVRLPSAAVATTIYYGYGKTTITTDQSNPTGVWVSFYTLVAHLRDGTTLSVADSSGFRTASTHGSPAATPALIDGGVYFNGVSNSQWIEWATGPILFTQPDFTLSAWIYPISLQNENFLWSENRTGGVILIARTTAVANKFEFGIFNDATFPFVTGATTLPTGAWSWVTVTRTAAGLMTVYVNGVSDGSASDAGYSASAITSVKTARIDNSGVEGKFDGVVDEVRVAITARSAAWVAADYKTQNSSATFWGALASEVDVAGGGGSGVGSVVFAPSVTALAPPSTQTIQGATIAAGGARFATPFIVHSSVITHVDYPTLVDRTAARFKSVANGGHVISAQGYDLLPYADAACTTRLDFEREFYDPTTGHVVDWVRVHLLTNGTTIYYGAGDLSITTSQSAPAAVWISHQIAVYHLGSTGGTLNTSDSTSQGYHATNSGATSVAGRFGGGGALFDAASDQLYSGATVSNFSTNAAWAFSCWIKPTFADSDTNLWAILGVGNVSTNDPRTQMVYRNDIGLYTEIVNGSTFQSHQMFPPFTANTWHYIVYSSPGSGAPSFWFDGVAYGRVDGGLGTALVVNQPFIIGQRVAAPACGFSGVIDEVRFYDTFTDGFRVSADYACQGDQDTWWGTLEAEVALSPGTTLNAPTIAQVTTSTQTIQGATISGASAVLEDVLLEDGSFALLEDGSRTLLEAARIGTAVTFAPTVISPPQAVSTAFRVSTLTLNAPVVAPGAVTVTASTIATGNARFAPAVTALVQGPTIVSGSGAFPPSVAQTVLAATISTTSVVRAPSLTLTVTGAFRASTAQVFTATVTTGPVSITTGTRPTTIQMFAPTVVAGAVGITGVTRPTTVQMFAPVVSPGAVTITGVHRPTTLACFPPALTAIAAGSIGAGTIPTTASVNAPSVVGGLATILVPTLSSTLTVTAPSVTVGAVTVAGQTRASTLQVFTPSVTVGPVSLTGATIGRTVQLIAPSVTTLTFITAGTRSSTAQVFVPVVTPLVGIGGGTVARTVLMFAPSILRPDLTTGFIDSTALVFGPAVETGGVVVTVGGLGSTVHVYPPALGRVFPLGTCLVSQVVVRYLVTSASVDGMMGASAGVTVRYGGAALTVASVVSVAASMQVRPVVTSADVQVCCVETIS